MKRLLTTLTRLYQALIKFDRDARIAYQLEDEQHRKENEGLSLSMMI